MRRLALAAAAAAFLVAPATASTAWKTHAGAGFTLATPAGWVDLAGSSPQLLEAIAKNPELAQSAIAARQNKLLKLIYADPHGFPNVNVIVVDAPVKLETFAALNLAQIESLSFLRGAVSKKDVQLPAGPAVAVRFLEKPAGKVVATRQYYLVHAGRGFVITYTSLPASEKRDDATFIRSAQSLRFAKAATADVSTSPPPVVPTCESRAAAPKSWVLACGDGNFYLDGLRWRHWGDAVATGTGVAHANDCKPNCAAGHFHTYPVVAEVSGLVACYGRKGYVQLVLHYTGRSPGTTNSETLNLGCRPA